MVVLQEKTRIPFSSRWTGAVRKDAASAVMEVSVPHTAGSRRAASCSTTIAEPVAYGRSVRRGAGTAAVGAVRALAVS